MYRERGGALEVLLVHPGGPFWRNKDIGAWTIPKGEIEPGEEPLETARREFKKELGLEVDGPFLGLGQIRQKAGKIVHAWAVRGDCDPSAVRCNIVRLEWPPKSGKYLEFPEIDRAEFFAMSMAKQKINSAQVSLLERMGQLV